MREPTGAFFGTDHHPPSFIRKVRIKNNDVLRKKKTKGRLVDVPVPEIIQRVLKRGFFQKINFCDQGPQEHLRSERNIAIPLW